MRSFEYLKGKRLGKNERSILLNAGSPGSYAALILRAVDQQEAFRRAAWRLERLQLIRIEKIREGTRVHDPRAHRPFMRNGKFYARNDKTRKHYVDVLVCWRTDFGEALVDVYRPELTGRQPIRWREAKYEAAKKSAELSPTPEANWKSAKSDLSLTLGQTLEPIQGDTPYVPPGCGPTELGRWDASVRIASARHPRAGSASLLVEADKIMRSDQSDSVLASEASALRPGPGPGQTAEMAPLPNQMDYAVRRETERHLRMKISEEVGLEG